MEYNICRVCGKQYKACSYCEAHKDFPSWRSVTCSRECFVHRIPIVGYINGHIDRNAAKEELLLADEKYGQVHYGDGIQKIVDEILSNK
ncbi:MAG: hypothetical protein K2F81_04610 [Ruminococcus sp.]|nr:hypothetical protein [Ruminococcus sp.]